MSHQQISQKCILDFIELFKDVLTIAPTTPHDIKTQLHGYGFKEYEPTISNFLKENKDILRVSSTTSPDIKLLFHEIGIKECDNQYQKEVLPEQVVEKELKKDELKKDVSVDKKEMFESLKLAADQGDMQSQYKVADMYGDDIQPTSFVSGPDKQFKTGLAYLNGDGVPVNKKEAFKYFKLAADQGHAEAQFNVGHLYGNKDESLKYYKLAADQGNIDAQYIVGNINFTKYTSISLFSLFSFGGNIKYKQEAIKYFKMAADQGHPIAQYKLKLIDEDDAIEKARQLWEKTIREELRRNQAGVLPHQDYRRKDGREVLQTPEQLYAEKLSEYEALENARVEYWKSIDMIAPPSKLKKPNFSKPPQPYTPGLIISYPGGYYPGYMPQPFSRGGHTKIKRNKNYKYKKTKNKRTKFNLFV